MVGGEEIGEEELEGGTMGGWGWRRDAEVVVAVGEVTHDKEEVDEEEPVKGTFSSRTREDEEG